VIDGVQIPIEKGNFEGKGRPIIKYIGTLCGHPCKNVRTDRYAAWVVGLNGTKESCVRWVQIPSGNGAILGKGSPIVKKRLFP